MKLANLFTDNRNADELLMHTVQALAARVDELEDLLDRECKRSCRLDELLRKIGKGTELRRYQSGSRYISTYGILTESDPAFQELCDILDLREEEDDERLSAVDKE